MSEEHPALQGLMDRAYIRWVDISRVEWLAGLEGDEITAVHFGNMNYQVENGGWSQWVDNNYATPEVICFIRNRMRYDLEQTPDVARAAQLLEEVTPHIEGLIDLYSRPPSERDYLKEGDLIERLSDFDDRYYAVNGGLLRAVENYLAARQERVAGA